MSDRWIEDKLNKIAATDDLHIAPFRADGETYGTPTWIWSVVVDKELFVRAYNGRSSRWYNSAIKQKAGQIIAAGMTIEVIFEQADADENLNKRIDDAYRKKYSDSPYLSSMISNRARSATVKVIPKGK